VLPGGLFCRVAVRIRLVPGIALALLVSVEGVNAAEEPGSVPALARESSSIKPAAERQLGAQSRPTIKKRTEAKADTKRAIRVSLQIPEALRATLAKRIDRRIARNVAASKKLRREAHGLLDKFIKESPEDSNELPEALVRIGELEWEESRDQFLTDFQAWEKIPADRRGQPPVQDYSKPRARFLRVLKNYKTFREYDLALYIDGFLANEEGKPEEALGRFNKILEWFPKSRFKPDAHMMRAEFEFTKDAPDYQHAYDEYEKVLAFKDTDLYDIALFKSAWTLWRLGKPEEAARRFLKVFQATEDGSKKRKRGELAALQSEALKNLVAVFVEDEKNSAEDMYKFLVQAGGDKFAGRIVRALAEALYDQAQYERGVEAYRLLMKLEPTSPEGYQYSLQIAAAHSTMENWKVLEEDYKKTIKDYVEPLPPKPGEQPPARSAWLSVQNAAVKTQAEIAVEKQLREDAVGLHAKAQADKVSRGEFEAAAALYRVYLSRFSTRKESYEASYNLADICFYRLEDAVCAADAYLGAVRINPKGELSRVALYNALASLEVARAAEFEAAKKAGKKQQETPTDKKFTEAMELYVRTYPTDKQIPELLFRQGKLYYDYEVYDAAVRQWGLLLEKYPNHQLSAGAGELILDSFNRSQDYVNIETWARRLKKTPSFQTPAQQSRLDGLIVGAMFKQGEQLAAQGEHGRAAAAYLRAAQEFPREARSAQAAVNAEVEARRAADLETLGAASALLVRYHKERPEAAQGIWIAASTYQEVGLFSEAANYHAILADSFPKSEHHKDAAFNAVLLRATVGEHDKAISSGETFRKLYPRDELSDEVTFLMGKAHEKAGKNKEADALYDRYSRSARSADGQIESLVRLAVVRKGDERGMAGALDRATHVASQHKGRLGDRGKYYAAKARYMQGEAILRQYEAVTIDGDVKQLKSRLKKKSELLKKAADAFLGTAELGVAEWTTASLYQIGFTYESFSKALLTSPPPSSLSADEKELYQQSIEEFVVPIEERALEAYESGWQKAIELGIFNAWTAKMREALGRLNAQIYPPLKEVGFELRSRGPMPFPPLIQGPRRTNNGYSQRYVVPVAGDDEKKDGSKNARPAGGAP
jgi:tetratricopeptide (TPR) repeat protein